MKILFVDESPNLQEKWIEPLRGEGWGVVRARSAADAEKIFEFHGDSLSALVVSESNADWAAKWNYPYVVFVKSWKENQILKHQNADHPATAYLDYDSNFELAKQAFMESKVKAQQVALKATGTSAAVKIPSAAAKAPANPELASIQSSSASDASVPPSEGIVIAFDQYSDKAEIETSKKSVAPAVAASPATDNDATRQITLDEVRAAAADMAAVQQPASEMPEISVESVVESPVEATMVTPSENDRTVMFDSNSLAGIEISPKVEEFIHETVDVVESPEEAAEIDAQIEDTFSPGHSYSMTEDAPVPSAATISTGGNKDLETMKNYLALREQDVALLTGQMRSAQERVQQLEAALKVEKARSNELQHLVQKQDQQIQNFERDKQVEFEVLYGQVEDLNLQLRERTDKVRTIEAKLKITTDEVEKVKERVRMDIRRIRVREKELESQLEVLKKDSTALLVARDEKILELKRKIDLLEFNMELVQEQYGKERNQTEQLRHKLKEAAGVMKRAGGLLDHEN